MKKIFKLILLLTLLNTTNAEKIFNEQEINIVTLGDLFRFDDTTDERFFNSAYRSADLIERALEERFEYSYSERASFLSQEALNIIDHSGKRNDEVLLRISLQRTYELGQVIARINGDKDEENNRWLASFYKEGFDFALDLSNSNFMLVSYAYNIPDYDSHVNYLTSAEFGRQHALRIWEFSTGLQTDLTKAVLLVKLVSYLAQDLKNDLRRRENHIIKSLADLYHVQQSKIYKEVHRTLMMGESPTKKDLAALRRSIFRVISSMNGRF